MRRNLWLVLALLLLVAGAVLVFTTNDTTNYGWFAYSPLDDNLDVTADALVLTRTQMIGVLLGVVGLLVLTGGAGYLAGRRRS